MQVYSQWHGVRYRYTVSGMGLGTGVQSVAWGSVQVYSPWDGLGTGVQSVAWG